MLELWYLVSLLTMNSIGPYSEVECKMAVVHLQNTVCKQATYTKDNKIITTSPSGHFQR